MKRHLTAFLAILVLTLALALPAGAVPGYAPDPEPTAPAVYLVNLDTDLVVYQKDAETQYQAASLTKLMTVILMMQDYQDQLDTVTVTAPRYIYDIIYGYNASSADILPGESHTLRELLYAMLLPSGNEAAYIVADYVGGGDLDSFFARMNAEAEAMGCTGTVFTDPCGLQETNLTTARDAYLLLRTAIGYNAVAEAIGTQEFDMGTDRFDRYSENYPYIIRNTNAMLYPGELRRTYSLGGKTGSLGAWQNFAGWQSQDGISYISVVLNAPYGEENDRSAAVRQTAALMDWAFDTFTIAPAIDTTQPISELPIAYSTQTDTVLLYPNDDMMTLLPKDGGADLTTRTFQLPDRLTAPIKQGDVVGTVTLSIEGETIGVVELAAGSSVSRSEVLYTLARVGEFFTSTYFKVVVILTMIALALYAFGWVVMLLIAVNNEGKSNGRRRQRRPDRR